MGDQDEYGPDDLMKVLLVADERFHGEALIEEIQSHIKGKSTEVEVFIIAPVLAHSALEHELGGIDEPLKEAGQRLDWLVAELKKVGIDAAGAIGDEDLTVAIGDGLRQFDADEIVLVAHAKGERTYAEKDIWQKVEQEHTLPVTGLMVHVESDGVGEVVSERHLDARAESLQDEAREGREAPPLGARDIFGILFAFFGTILIGLMALEAGLDDNGNIAGAAALILLIAFGAFIINITYIVGILLFRSVMYSGPWVRFFSLGSLVVTALGLVISSIALQTLG